MFLAVATAICCLRPQPVRADDPTAVYKEVAQSSAPIVLNPGAAHQFAIAWASDVGPVVSINGTEIHNNFVDFGESSISLTSSIPGDDSKIVMRTEITMGDDGELVVVVSTVAGTGAKRFTLTRAEGTSTPIVANAATCTCVVRGPGGPLITCTDAMCNDPQDCRTAGNGTTAGTCQWMSQTGVVQKPVTTSLRPVTSLRGIFAQ